MEEAARLLNTRAKHLLLTLLDEQGPVVIANLARQFGVSPRSIRYDLDEIESWLRPTLVRLCRRPRVGIWVEGPPEAFAGARERLGMVEEYRPVLSPEQRRNIIVAQLLKSDEPVTSHALADQLHVSRTTVFADLDNVQGWLEQRGLSLVRRSNYGLRVVGEESAWRQAVSDLLNEFAESGELGRLLMRVGRGGAPAEDDEALDAGTPHLMALLQGVDLERVEAMVQMAEAAAGVEFTTGSYSALVFHIAVAVERLSQGKEVRMSRDRLAALKSYGEYALARLLARQMAEEFAVAVPEAEVGNLTLHLIGARVRGPAGTTVPESEDIRPALDIEASAAAGILVSLAAQRIGLPLDEPDLRRGLALHLRPAFGRVRFGLPVTNPFLERVRAAYPRLFAVAEAACREVEPVVGLSIPAEEVGYVTMHLAAAVLRRRQGCRTRLRVVVASTGGVGVSEHLSTRLECEFPNLEVIACSSAHRLAAVVGREQPDFVVSSAPVPHPGCEVIVVEPLLGEDDVARLRSYLDREYRLTEERLLAEVGAI